MSCSGCEARREWIKESIKRAKRKRDLLLQRFGFGINQEQSGADRNNESSERSDGSNRGPE